MITRLRPVAPAVRKFGWSLIDLALPPRCLHCEDDLMSATDISLCLKCVQLIAPELPECCGRCGAVLPDGLNPSGGCPSCKGYPLKFDAVYPLGRYDGAMKEVVLKTKRLSSEALSLTVGRLLAERLRDKIVQFGADVVIPVPMHWTRRFRRGINSPELLADSLSRKLGIPVLGTLRRRRYTKPQKDVQRHERFSNVRDAFGLLPWRRKRLKDARVLLVDDILTTGATCSEAAKLLKQAGAAAVAVAVVARADTNALPRAPEFIRIGKPK